MTSIEKLREKRSKLFTEIEQLDREINSLELADYNYEGKYIFYEDHGFYMYVTRQQISRKGKDDGYMFLQGFGFSGGTSPYRDDFSLKVDAMDDHWIPLRHFRECAMGGMIKVLSKWEFIKALEGLLLDFKSGYRDMLESVEKPNE